MATTQPIDTADVGQMVMEEVDRRLETYYELARPGEADSPIEPMESGSVWFVTAVAVALIALWLIGRFVILPIYT